MRRSSRPKRMGPSSNIALDQRPQRLALPLLLLGLLATSVCACGPVKAPPAVVLFDEGHGQRFLPEQKGDLDLSSLATLIRDQGSLVKSDKHPFSESTLSGVNAVVISGPFAPLTAAETDAVVAFLKRGGRLSVMLHIASPVADLLHKLEVSISNGVIRETEGVLENDALNFRVTHLASHELTKNVGAFNVFGAWALLNTADNATLTAETGPGAWVDLNGDQELGDGDAAQAFGVVVTGQLGKGRFVVFGDDAIFQNRFLSGGNAVLGKNLATWLGQTSERGSK